MELELSGKNENKALHRTELVFLMKEAKVTPSRKELRPKLAAMANAKENLTVITSVGHSFGKREAVIRANVYESEDFLKKAEPKHLVARDLGKKKEKAEKGKPAEGQEEKPAEGKKPEEGKEEKAGEGKQEKEAGKPEAAKEKPEAKQGEGKEDKQAKEEPGKKAGEKGEKPAKGKQEGGN